MKKILMTAFALLMLGLTSCNQEDNATVENSSASEEVFGVKVLEEKEISGDELFAMTMGQREDCVDAELYDKIKESFNSSYNELPSVTGTRAIVPALYKTVRIEYQTTDEAMRPITASALIVYPLLKRMNKVMLLNHGTQIGFMMVPTQYTSVEGIMAATGALCVMPDYIGLGSSKKHPDLYLNHDVHGRTSVDALLALLDYAKAKRLPLDSNYKTTILGYSQGGSVSLASLRRVQQLDAATQARIRLDRVFCGDGPYDLRRTFETYMEDYEAGKPMGLGSVIPLVINSMFNSYPDEMAGINYEDFFTAEALKTGVPQAIRQNREGILDMVVWLNGKNLGQILNIPYIEANPEHLNRLLGLMDRQNLCKGWTPEYKLKLLHCNPDGVVPFSNFEEAVEYLKNDKVETEVVDINTKIISDPLLQHIYGMLVMLAEIMGE